MDGIAVMLLVLVAGFGLVVQPLADRSSHSWVATVVDFGYPVLDVLLIGALLGIYGLLGWKPDAMWLFIGCGIAACTVADAAFAVEQAHSMVETSHYDFVMDTRRALHRLRSLGITDSAPGQPPGHRNPRHCCARVDRSGLGHRHPDHGHLQRDWEE